MMMLLFAGLSALSLSAIYRLLSRVSRRIPGTFPYSVPLSDDMMLYPFYVAG